MIMPVVRKFGSVFQIGLCAITCLAALTLIIPDAFAAEFLKGKNVHLTSLHRIDGDVYASGSDITIDGSITGDLLAVGGVVDATGETGGSMMIVAGKLFHTGRTEGSIRMVCDRGEIDGYVGRSILFFGNTLEIHRGAEVRSDVNAFGFRVDLDGVVRGDVTIRAARISLSGRIEGDVDLEASESITIRPPAVIHGDLIYTCSNELDLGDETGITVLGEITHVEPVESDDDEEGTTATALRFSLLFAAFLFGLILIRLFPTHLTLAFDQLHHRFMASAGAGLLTAAVVLMCSLVLIVAIALSLVGVILTSSDQVVGGMLLLVFSTLLLPVTSLACVSGGVLFYVGKLLPGWLIGYGLIRIFKKQPKKLGKWQLLIGLTILTGLYVPPGGGWIFYLAAGIVGTGAIVLAIRENRRRMHPPKPETTVSPPVEDSLLDPPTN